MSGMLGSLLFSLTGAAGDTRRESPSEVIGSLLQSVGGVQGLVARFEQAGLGAHISSWVGSGANLDISAAEITRVFPADQIEAFAVQHGVPAGMAAGLLAQFLPGTVDAATPNGRVEAPEGQADAATPHLAAGGTATDEGSEPP